MTVTALPRVLLRPQNREKRLAFALRYRDDVDTIRNVLWSDETSVQCYPQKRKISVIVHSSTADVDIPFAPAVQQGGFKVMFWGCFSFHAIGPLLEIEGTIDQHSYLKLIKDEVEPQLNASEVPLTYMQDNARPHTAKIVTRYLGEKNIPTLNWPPQSPDLNPIKNIWHIIKQDLYTQSTFPKNRTDLIDRVFKIWEKIDKPLLETLSKSVTHRLYAVAAAKGGWFKK